MARIYAGVLGLLAFLTSLLRGLVHGSGAEGVLSTACMSTALFAAIGMIVGGWAQWIVEDSVQSRLTAEVAAESGKKTEKDFAQRAQ